MFIWQIKYLLCNFLVPVLMITTSFSSQILLSTPISCYFSLSFFAPRLGSHILFSFSTKVWSIRYTLVIIKVLWFVFLVKSASFQGISGLLSLLRLLFSLSLVSYLGFSKRPSVVIFSPFAFCQTLPFIGWRAELEWSFKTCSLVPFKDGKPMSAQVLYVKKKSNIYT